MLRVSGDAIRQSWSGITADIGFSNQCALPGQLVRIDNVLGRIRRDGLAVRWKATPFDPIDQVSKDPLGIRLHGRGQRIVGVCPPHGQRSHVHLKRSRKVAGNNGSGRQIRVGQLMVDASLRTVSLAGKPIDLTTMQFELLWHLAKRSGRVVSRDELYDALYNEKYNGFDRSVDVYISRIRQQLMDDVDNPSFLKTIRGVGYLFVGHDGNGG
jgi:DNA-binding winged helix-turn-helix (wHTH) protein